MRTRARSKLLWHAFMERKPSESAQQPQLLKLELPVFQREEVKKQTTTQSKTKSNPQPEPRKMKDLSPCQNCHYGCESTRSNVKISKRANTYMCGRKNRYCRWMKWTRSKDRTSEG